MVPAIRCRRAKIRRFEIVTVATDQFGDEWTGRRGTVFWCDRPWCNRRTRIWSEWIYCVNFVDIGRYGTFKESSLEPSGVLDSEERLLGRDYEISFDCVLGDDDHVFVEGCYRIPGRHWEIFTFDKTGPTSESDFPALRWNREATWQSGITGVAFEVPKSVRLDRDFMLRAMADAFGSAGWVEVRGVDSIYLK